MALSEEDKKEIRAVVRQEINKAAGTVLSVIKGTEAGKGFVNTLEKQITYALLKGLKESEAEMISDSEDAKRHVGLIPEDAKLPTY